MALIDQPLNIFAAGVSDLAKSIAVGLAHKPGVEIQYLPTTAKMYVHVPEPMGNYVSAGMPRVEVKTPSDEEHQVSVNDVVAALQSMPAVDKNSIDTLHIGLTPDHQKWSQVFFRSNGAA